MASERMSCSEIRFWAGILLEPPNDSSYLFQLVHALLLIIGYKPK
jgi:hypothetical protein